jgi:histidinol-phosphate aminotransferase
VSETITKVLELARPTIRTLKPYSSARSVTKTGDIFLDANESPWGEFNRYPEPQPWLLRNLLAKIYERDVDEVFLGRGTDEAIDTLVRTFCESGKDSILICPPTYGVYEVAAHIQGAKVSLLPQFAENGFSISTKRLIEAHRPDIKIVFLCSPNNPTGHLIDDKTLEEVTDGLREKAVVVVDEAYMEFSGKPSFARRIDDFPNLIVLRTLSKAWGLAGVRCGVALGHPAVVELLQKVRAPYPLSTPAVREAMKALTSQEAHIQLRERITEIARARENLRSELSKFSFVEQVFPSAANFILIKVKDATSVMEACRRRGIVLRDRSHDFGLMNCIRISVGTPSENVLFLKALAEINDA